MKEFHSSNQSVIHNSNASQQLELNIVEKKYDGIGNYLESTKIYYKTKEIHPKVTYTLKPVVSKDSHNPQEGVFKDVVVTKEVTVTEKLHRTVTLCMVVEKTLGVTGGTFLNIRIGSAVCWPKYDDPDNTKGKDIAKGKALERHFYDSELEMFPGGFTREIRDAIFNSIFKDMEKNFGNYVAAYRES